MKFKVTKIETENFKIPAQLSNFRRLSSSLATKTRKFNISNAGHSMGKKHQINEKVFDINRIDERVNAGSYEIWEIDNLQGDEIHPMHIHGAFFQILERSGRALQANEMGWKDTVLLMPKEKASILIQFPENKGKFLFHCHNLEHEDDGMMLNYEII